MKDHGWAAVSRVPMRRGCPWTVFSVNSDTRKIRGKPTARSLQRCSGRMFNSWTVRKPRAVRHLGLSFQPASELGLGPFLHRGGESGHWISRSIVKGRDVKKRIGWTTCPSIGGQYAVAELLEGGVVGNGLITFPTKEAAQQFIDSGKADELGARGRKPSTPST